MTLPSHQARRSPLDLERLESRDVPSATPFLHASAAPIPQVSPGVVAKVDLVGKWFLGQDLPLSSASVQSTQVITNYTVRFYEYNSTNQLGAQPPTHPIPDNVVWVALAEKAYAQ